MAGRRDVANIRHQLLCEEDRYDSDGIVSAPAALEG
jgi:hypothetical protein